VARSTVSSRTRADLAAGEGRHVDFKRGYSHIKPEDFVSFANSQGGRVYLGVDEIPGQVTRGRIVGTSVTDSAQLEVSNKASDCSPPVDHRLNMERDSRGRAILVVDIPESSTKPHCTPSGRYLIRYGSRNTPLEPDALRSIVLGTQPRRTIQFPAFVVRESSEGPLMKGVLGDYPLQFFMSVGDEAQVTKMLNAKRQSSFCAIACLVALVHQSGVFSFSWVGPAFQNLSIERPFLERITVPSALRNKLSQTLNPALAYGQVDVPRGWSFCGVEAVEADGVGELSAVVLRREQSFMFFGGRRSGGQIFGPSSLIEFMQPAPMNSQAAWTEHLNFVSGYRMTPDVLHSSQGVLAIQFFNETVANIAVCFGAAEFFSRRPHPAMAQLQLMVGSLVEAADGT
jgi:hypothetical protein